MRKAIVTSAVSAILTAALLLAGCSGGGASSGGGSTPQASGGSGGAATSDTGSTSGPAYSEPSSVALSTFDSTSAQHIASASIDTSTCNEGYVGVSATGASRLKFQVVHGDESYNYDLPNDGTPIIVPMNMGNGSYNLRVMQNTSGTSYIEVAATTANVSLSNEFEPFLHPNIFCDYNEQSACVKKAYDLCSSAQNEGDVVRSVYEWMVGAIAYDDAKAAKLATTTGYVPDPDDTMRTGTGICFDYASLAGAMFRSLGIPCQIITGYVSPDDIYHAWNMVYIDGQWVSAAITVDANKWVRIDLTFAAAGATSAGTIGDGTSYTDRYVY